MSETTNEIRNVIIIGSGPAGYTAALYTARANLKPLLIAGSADKKTSRIKGGQLMATSDIENFPGAIETSVDLDTFAFLEGDEKEAALGDVKGLSGPHLMTRMEMQARHFGTEMLEEFVTEVDICTAPGELYTVTTETGKTFQARALIIASGAAAKTMGIAAEDKFFGQGGGVSTCATCDGHSYRGKTVAVVGGGDSAMEEASYLANLGIDVHLIHRRDEFRSSRIMLDRVRKNPKITIHEFRQIVDLLGKPHPLAETSKFFADKEVVRAAVLEDPRDGSTEELELDGVFVAIGHTPNTSVFADQFKDGRGEISGARPSYARDSFDERLQPQDARHGLRARHFRGGRCFRSYVSPGDYRRWHGLHGGHRSRALYRRKAGRMGRLGRQRCEFIHGKHRRLALEQQQGRGW